MSALFLYFFSSAQFDSTRVDFAKSTFPRLNAERFSRRHAVTYTSYLSLSVASSFTTSFSSIDDDMPSTAATADHP